MQQPTLPSSTQPLKIFQVYFYFLILKRLLILLSGHQSRKLFDLLILAQLLLREGKFFIGGVGRGFRGQGH